MTSPASLPPEVDAALRHTAQLCSDYLQGVVFLAMDTARNSDYSNTHLLTFAIDEFFEVAVAIPDLARGACYNTCRRELRFLLEASIKLCFVQQSSAQSTIEDKLVIFQRELDSSSISLKNSVSLDLLPEIDREELSSQVGRLYGETSKFVHLTVHQLESRMRIAGQGHAPASLSKESLISLNESIEKTLSASFVYLSHSVPQYAAADFLVRRDGSSNEWCLGSNRFIALLDEHFDYKHERTRNLQSIRNTRWARVDA